MLGTDKRGDVRRLSLTTPPRQWDLKADVVVVGAGVAGLMAAIEAHDRGAFVLLVEMADSPYCSASAICGGGMAVPGTDIQAAQGVHDSAGSLINDMIRTGRGSNRTELVRLFAENVSEAYDRLRELGAVCTKLGYIGGHAVAREHQHDPMQVQQVLHENVQSRGIRTVFGTRVRGLALDRRKGQVVGAYAVDGSTGDLITIGGRAVVLATGGMCGNPEMLDRYAPRLHALATCVAVGPDRIEMPIGLGDGYRMAMAVGADTTHMYSVATYTGVPHPDLPGFSNRSRRPWLPSYQEGAIAVNRSGRRFVEETRTPPCEIGISMLEQPGRTLFKICDNQFWKTIKQGEAEADLIKRGKAFVWVAETIRELAMKAGIDPSGLAKEVERYNQSVANGMDTDLGRPREYLRPITEPPFVAHQNWLIALHNSGGLRVSERLEVLHVSGEVIPGLYGAGEVVGGTSGEVYLTATHYPASMTSGFLVGRYFAVQQI